MNLIHKTNSQLTCTQIPVLLYLIGSIFSLPMLIFGIYNILKQTGADGSIFTSILGLLTAWLVVEVIATRQIIIADRQKAELIHIAAGLFFSKKQHINLKNIEFISLENKRVSKSYGRRKQHIYLCNEKEKFLVNNPSLLYIDHNKTAKLLSEFLGMPIKTFEEDLFN